MPAIDGSLIKIEDITFDTLNIRLKLAMGEFNWVFIFDNNDFKLIYKEFWPCPNYIYTQYEELLSGYETVLIQRTQLLIFFTIYYSNRFMYMH